MHDDLTGLLNRRGLMLLGPALVASGRRAGNAVYASFVDVDGLKGVNDQGGHAAGDAVLTAVADALASVVRAGDVVARFGGDEFCVLGQGPGAAPVDLERRVGERLTDAPPVPLELWPSKVSVGGAMLAPVGRGQPRDVARGSRPRDVSPAGSAPAPGRRWPRPTRLTGYPGIVRKRLLLTWPR